MPGLEIAPAGPSDREAIAALDRSVCDASSHPALGDAVWRDIDRPQPDSVGFLARDGNRLLAYVHVARSDTFTAQHWTLGLARDPSTTAASETTLLLDAAERHIAAHRGGRSIVWIFDPSPADDALLATNHFTWARDLYQMRVPLPIAQPPTFPEGIQVRAFEPGRDEGAWLEVNNRAFGNHPDQGHWVAATLERRMAEPWFDPELFLLAFIGNRLVGSNWLKVHTGAAATVAIDAGHDGEPHADATTSIGEIFVIGVDPSQQGTGLGRALALEGLARLAALGITTGMLYVAAENTAAFSLYSSLGFTVHRTDRAYEHDVDAS